MKILKSTQGLLLITAAGLLLTLGMPSSALANPQGHGRKNDDNRDYNKETRQYEKSQRKYNKEYSKEQRKCGKFVNCHDARDGRLDGNGPQRSTDSRWNLKRRYRSYNRSSNHNFLEQLRLARFRRQQERRNR